MTCTPFTSVVFCYLFVVLEASSVCIIYQKHIICNHNLPRRQSKEDVQHCRVYNPCICRSVPTRSDRPVINQGGCRTLSVGHTTLDFGRWAFLVISSCRNCKHTIGFGATSYDRCKCGLFSYFDTKRL